jgi:hypothetical protein
MHLGRAFAVGPGLERHCMDDVAGIVDDIGFDIRKPVEFYPTVGKISQKTATS